jgi:hypothetical protein
MFEALIYTLIAIAIILGGAMVLIQNNPKPKVPKNIKTPEQLDKEQEDYDQWKDD